MKNTETKLRTTVFLRPSLIKHAKAQAVIEEITLTELIERALLKYLPKETIIKKIDFRKPVGRQ
ncbi:hypothetical protein C4561_01265 [candidate division WWE3 bacterium]|jgi:hypothetical protein|uniref:CopG family transcriptional regulator n=1 Tax=candidate division WWE3 bacterium TaxID=2053526 RepID=A0A3A4ZFW6_UNCKA|nr:MAG: hypothetical protein C4561_01265 [candidate division WWE3 bacterium]